MKGKMKKILIIFLFGVLFILSPLMSEVWIGAQEQSTEQKFQGFNLQGYTESGEKSWDVKGDTADILGEEIKLKNVDAHTYGDQKMTVQAENGTINQTKGKMRLEKDVVVTSEKGSQLTTDSLDWHQEEDLVTTEDDVTIKDKNYTIFGTGMDAHPGLKNARIKEDVTVLVDTESKAKESNRVMITSDGPMVIDQGASNAVFQDNVVAVRGDQTLKADRMEVYFNADMSGISKLVCIGHVEILQGENVTYAEKAVYEGQTKKLVLTGRPKLIFVTEGEGAITSFKD